MKLSRPLAIFLGGCLVACGNPDSPKLPSNSKLASFTVGEYAPVSTGPDWTTMTVDMQRKDAATGSINKKLNRSQFRSAKFEEQALFVDYGTYTIDLLYYDQGSTMVYRACEEDRNKEHGIAIPTFEVMITVCEIKAGQPEKPAGQVPFKPLANVAITAVPKESGAKPGTSGGNPSQTGTGGSSSQGGSGGNPVQGGSGSNPVQGGQAATVNPFVGKRLFVNPTYAAQVDSSIQLEPALASKFEKVKNVPTAIWIDRLESIRKIEPALSEIRSLQRARPTEKIVATFVVYNLPERDCAARASAGELSIAQNGLQIYKSQFIDTITALFAKYNDVNIVAIIEPDSLPNMATNMGVPKCVTAAPLYKEGVAYAIQKLSKLANVSIYLDSAHGGWLGWPDNRRKMAAIFKEVLDMAGGSNLIRGFATNVSNYSPLRVTSATMNGADYYQGNPAVDELTFVQLLAQDFQQVGIENRHFVIDTSRNGNPQSRRVWGAWCNVRLAGIGERPTIAPTAGVDAYIWVKPPGESDGISDSSAARFDSSCTSSDSILGAPEAGVWFHEHFKSMVLSASPAL